MQDIKRLDHTIKHMLLTIERGRNQIINIARDSRRQRDELMARLVEVKGEIVSIITESDRLERDFKLARHYLIEVNRNFQLYSEREIQVAYEEAQHLQLQLTAMREREEQLRKQRAHLENMLRHATETLSRAEKLENQVGLAIQLLSGDLHSMTVKLDELQTRQQLSLRIIMAQEEERQRVAREIHDGPAQSMANVVLRAEICEKLMDLEPEKVRQELHDLKTMVRESLQEVRKIIFNLRPMVLDDLGIVPTLKRYLVELQKRTDIVMELVVLGDEEQRLPSALEVAIFRIVQEALNNTVKHSAAGRCVIKLEILAGRVNIVVSDDGCGFDTQQVLEAAGGEYDSFGLLGMRERVQLLAGKIDIRSAPGKGTEISITIPTKR
ncbi:MAG TPA: histidine kinase [Firmicutes bacterium]|nr:histidine kinase [Bacillota bacterium]